MSSKEITANPLANSGIELGAFDNMATLFLRIAEAKLTAVPKGNVLNTTADCVGSSFEHLLFANSKI